MEQPAATQKHPKHISRIRFTHMGNFRDKNKCSIISTVPLILVGSCLIYFVAMAIVQVNKYSNSATFTNGQHQFLIRKQKTTNRDFTPPYTQKELREMVKEASIAFIETTQANKSIIQSSAQESTKSELYTMYCSLTMFNIKALSMFFRLC